MTASIEQQILSLEKHIAQQPNSPLFAQLASYYLDAGRTQEALSLCDKGLALYPFYTTGHLIKGKTLLALNMRAEARREFEIVHDSMPANQAVTRLLADIPPSSEETLVAPSPAEEVSAPGIRTIKPKQKAQPAIESQAADHAAPETPPPAETAAEQVLTQFTEPQAEAAPETAAEEPIPSPEFTAPETPAPAEPVPEVSVSTEDPFGLTTPEAAETFAATPEVPQDTFSAEPQIAQQQAAEEGEPFDQFAERKRMELMGTENALSLEDYLYGNQSQPATAEPAPAEPPQAETVDEDPFAALRQLTVEEPAAPEPPPQAEEQPTERDQIEEIAEKLKEAKRITPVINLSEKSTTPLSESETPAGTGFVTPTLAEIYAKQGWFDDAIKAYKTLAANKPMEREKFEKRIEELEEMKKQQQPGQ